MQLLTLWPKAKIHAQIWQFQKSSRISETAAGRAQIINFDPPTLGRKRICATYGTFDPSFMPKFGDFKNRPVSRKPLHVERK